MENPLSALENYPNWFYLLFELINVFYEFKSLAPT
jgi:hypothetical protein